MPSKKTISPLSLEVQIRQTPQSAYHIIDLDEADALHFLSNGQKRIIITFPNGKSFHRAVQNTKGWYRISLGKATVREAKVQVGEIVTITLAPDHSKYGMPFPVEFEEVLNQDPEALQKWEELTPGRRRSVLHYISGGKAIDTRINRSLLMAERLKEGLNYS